MSEHDEQVKLFNWLEKNGIHEAFAIPNGGLRDKRTARMLQAEGVKPGVPDVFIPIGSKDDGYHGLWIELKLKKGRASQAQLWWINRLEQNGYKAIICHGAKAAEKEIEKYLDLQ